MRGRNDHRMKPVAPPPPPPMGGLPTAPAHDRDRAITEAARAFQRLCETLTDALIREEA